MTGRCLFLGLSLLVSLTSAPSGADADPLLGRGFDAMVALPGGTFSAATIEGRQGLVFLSANGRYAIRGVLTDLWSGETLTTLDAVRASTARLDLAGLEDFWDDLAPEHFGTGPAITLFVDPACPACGDLMARIGPWIDRFTFRVIPVPALSKGSGAVVRALHCAADREAARRAIRQHRFGTTFDPRPDCDLAPLKRRLVVTQLLGISEVPTAIAADGRVHKGTGTPFETWLGGLAR